MNLKRILYMKRLISLLALIISISCDTSVNREDKITPHSWTKSSYWSYYDWDYLLHYKNLYFDAYIGNYSAFKVFDKEKGIPHLSLPSKEIKIIWTFPVGQSGSIHDPMIINYDNLGRISKINDTEYFYNQNNRIDSIIENGFTTIYKYENDLLSGYITQSNGETTDSADYIQNDNLLKVYYYGFDHYKLYEIDPNLNLAINEESWSFGYDNTKPIGMKKWLLDNSVSLTYTEYSDNILINSKEYLNSKEYFLYNDDLKLDSINRENSNNCKFEYNSKGNINSYVSGTYKKEYYYDEMSGLPKKCKSYQFNGVDSLWEQFEEIEIVY